MIQTIIVDDEEDGINTLIDLLEENFSSEIMVAGSFKTFEDAYNGIARINPDLIFLDVELGGKTGFDLLRLFGKRKFNVVFTTAHDKYAFEAFNVNAVHFVLKPIDIDDLEVTVAKVKKELLNQRLWETLSNFSAPGLPTSNAKKPSKETLKKVIISTGKGIILENIEDIIWLESGKNGVTVYLQNNKSYLDYKTLLSEYHARLSENSFYLVHESRLVNVMHIKSYDHSSGKITMINDSHVYVSERKRAAFKAYLSTIYK